ncbi:hypothetical protein UlMin_029012 [Ulmus minor]
MTSKLVSMASHEAENQTEASLRQAFELLEPKLRPPFALKVPSPEGYFQLNRAIVYGVLCEPHFSKIHIKHLHAIVTDGYCFFVDLLVGFVNELYVKLVDSAKIQLIWVAREMIDVEAVGLDDLLICLLRQIVGGDFSEDNLWLCSEILNLLWSKWDCLVELEPMILTSALYCYLRLLPDHCRLVPSKKLEALKQLEIKFCVRMLKEQFSLCMKIGRDLIRLLQELVHVPEFKALWKDLVFNPSEFKTPGFSDISQIYGTRTSSRLFLLRISPEMEAQLRFLLTHVKFGSQRRYQTWFAKKFLFGPERETLISDIVRFICCAHHPPNEIIQSEVVPRWAVVGWLLKCCTKNYIEANAKLALFYDWLFFDEKVDNIMNIEPAILLMVNSIPRYIDMTHTLLDFLFLLVDNYDMERKFLIVKGVSSSFGVLVRRGVIRSLDVLISCGALAPFLKERLGMFLSGMEMDACKNLRSSHLPLPIVIPSNLQNSSAVETQMLLSKVQSTRTKEDGSASNKSSDASVRISDDSAASCIPSVVCVDTNTLENLIRNFGEAVQKSNKMDLEPLEELLSSFVNLDNQVLSKGPQTDLLSSEIAKIYELNGYRLFAPLEFLQDNPDYDDELGSPTALIIRSFIYSQHQRMQEMLVFWSRHGFRVGARFLSYASRIAYEEHRGGHDLNELVVNKSTKGSDLNLLLLSFHVGSKMEMKPVSKLADGAFAAYRCFLMSLSTDADTSPSKLLFSDLLFCSGWKRKSLKNLSCSVFSHLSDLSIGNADFIRLLVDQLDHNDLVDMQFEIGLKKFSIFGENAENISNMIKNSLSWDYLLQHKLWALLRSEIAASEVKVEEIVMDFFCSDELDANKSAIAAGGLLALCSCRAPTPELVGAIIFLPNTTFPDFAATVLSTWAVSNVSMLFDSMANFSEKLGCKSDLINSSDGITINRSAILWLFDYHSARGLSHEDILSKFSS